MSHHQSGSEWVHNQIQNGCVKLVEIIAYINLNTFTAIVNLS